MAIMRLRREDPRVVGSFRLHRRLGAGGMGVVYLGSDRRGQRVALKLIRPELAEDPEFRSRFAREVAAATRIRSGCIARLVASDLEAERPWLATQYVPGPSLYDKVGSEGPLPAAEVAAIGAALAEGLVAVHEAGVVHRDLKPSNILLSPRGPRIIDFGIAWATGATTLTHVGTAVGSPGFLAPEQVRGAAVTAATDVFALGATLAYAATADGPFGQGSSEVMLYRVVHEQPDLRQVPDALAPLLNACLAKDPQARPSPAQLHGRLSEIHAREVRGISHEVHHPRRAERPAGRAPAARPAIDTEYARQRTVRRPSPNFPAKSPPAKTSALPTQPARVPVRAAASGRPGPNRPAPGRPAAKQRPQQASAPGRPPASSRRLLRQRLIVFVTVTLAVALGIAIFQGCHGAERNGGLRAPSVGTGSGAFRPREAQHPALSAPGRGAVRAVDRVAGDGRRRADVERVHAGAHGNTNPVVGGG